MLMLFFYLSATHLNQSDKNTKTQITTSVFQLQCNQRWKKCCRSFTYVKAVMPKFKSTPLQVKVLHSKIQVKKQKYLVSLFNYILITIADALLCKQHVSVAVDHFICYRLYSDGLFS